VQLGDVERLWVHVGAVETVERLALDVQLGDVEGLWDHVGGVETV
jgi:hypothetical protein